MPARSKSQQRLFGMVHAYNKGELHAGRALRDRIAALSRRISDDDARHFAKTPHDGLPERKEKEEKRAQVAMFRPDEVYALYDRIEPRIEAMANRVSERSKKRRSFLGHVVSGTSKGALWGSLVGGLGLGALGVGMARHVSDEQSVPPDVAKDRMIEAGAKLGLFGAGSGALVGSVTGLGLGVLNGIRE